MGPLSPLASRETLGQELRRRREDAGLLIADAAHALECSQSKVSRLETGKGIPRQRDVRDLLDLYRVTDRAVRDELLTLATDGRADEWWSEYRDVVRGALFADRDLRFVEFEQEATSLLNYENELVPGLLQRPEYVEAVAALLYPQARPAALARFVEFRLRRQEVLRGRHRSFAMVVNEAALLHAVGGPQVMGAQLDATGEALRGELDHVDLRILPLHVTTAGSIGGPFVVLRFADDRRDCVYLESRGEATYLTDEDRIDSYDQVFEQLVAAALPRDASLDRLAAIARSWRSDTPSGAGPEIIGGPRIRGQR